MAGAGGLCRINRRNWPAPPADRVKNRENCTRKGFLAAILFCFLHIKTPLARARVSPLLGLVVVSNACEFFCLKLFLSPGGLLFSLSLSLSLLRLQVLSRSLPPNCRAGQLSGHRAAQLSKFYSIKRARLARVAPGSGRQHFRLTLSTSQLVACACDAVHLAIVRSTRSAPVGLLEFLSSLKNARSTLWRVHLFD